MKDNRAGVQMQQVDLLMRYHNIEERGEGRNQPHEKSMEMDGDLSGTHLSSSPRCSADSLCPSLIGISDERMVNLVQPLLVDHRRLLEGWLQGRRRTGRGRAFPFFFLG